MNVVENLTAQFGSQTRGTRPRAAATLLIDEADD